MPSQLDILKASLAKLEPVHGADNPFVQGLKAQIAYAERRREGMFVDNPMGEGRPLDVALSAGLPAASAMAPSSDGEPAGTSQKARRKKR